MSLLLLNEKKNGESTWNKNPERTNNFLLFGGYKNPRRTFLFPSSNSPPKKSLARSPNEVNWLLQAIGLGLSTRR